MARQRVAERRAHRRHRVALDATVGTEADLPVRCRTVDVSLGGALVETPTLLDDHVIVVLALDAAVDPDAGRLIPIAADVVDQVLDTKAGVIVARVAFRRMTRGGRDRLSQALAALNSG